MKKMFKLFLSAFLVLSLTVVSEHTHDGYDSETETSCDVVLTGLGRPGPGEEDPSN